MSRREAIAVAAVELVAEGGSHALTHRRIDRRLGLPEGTTSNYARNRRDLVRMVVDRVADVAEIRGDGDRAPQLPQTVSEAVDQLLPAFEATVSRGTDTRARMALSIDCWQDEELHTLLTTDSPVREKLLDEATRMLISLGVPDPEQRAGDFIAVMNGLLYDRLIGHGVRGTPADAANILRAWLTGIGGRQ
ncbi:TetR family transcriptional regulator [Stackebrandtia endophytica]|uniref:TetR family transcriptional regulator n=1 Tax=Stackebrandtia endophytica TaxID=1496996 RepID=A0A543AVK9_9ACTN|nr:TetR/AcrR family transcriptional regulator [Stackebrandtia endophytica]TQL76615.1 TetR family transcriptional regulator [Stackebrandtia endophytica]